MTFEVKLLITFVATHPMVILTKFGQNPIKHVEEEANCEKEERRRKKKKDMKKCARKQISLLGVIFRLNLKRRKKYARKK